MGLLEDSLLIPPPELLELGPVFIVNVQFVSVGLLDLLHIPPPLPNRGTELLVNVQSVSVGLLFS